MNRPYEKTKNILRNKSDIAPRVHGNLDRNGNISWFFLRQHEARFSWMSLIYKLRFPESGLRYQLPSVCENLVLRLCILSYFVSEWQRFEKKVSQKLSLAAEQS